MEPENIYNQQKVPPLAQRNPPAAPAPGAPSKSDAPSIAPRVMTLDGGHRSRSRRRRSHSYERKSFRGWMILWGGVLLLVGAYLAVLAFSKFHKPAPKGGVEPAAAEVTNAPATNTPARDDGVVSQDLQSKIRLWGSAQHDAAEARSLQSKGNLDQAVMSLNKALDADSNLTEAQAALAEILFQQEKYREAEDLIIIILSGNPEQLAVRQMLANTYAAQHLYQSSLAAAKWMLEADPYSMDAHTLAAQSYAYLDQHVMAADHWKKVANVQRDNTTALNALAQSYLKLGRINDAIESLKSVLEVDSKNSASYYNLAVSYALQNNVDAAVDTMTRAAGLFGNTFVEAWTKGADFEGVRTNESFRLFQEQLANPVTAAPAVEPGAETNEPAAPVTP